MDIIETAKLEEHMENQTSEPANTYARPAEPIEEENKNGNGKPKSLSNGLRKGTKKYKNSDPTHAQPPPTITILHQFMTIDKPTLTQHTFYILLLLLLFLMAAPAAYRGSPARS